MDFLKRTPKNLDSQGSSEHEIVDQNGMIGENASAQRRQKLALFGGVAIIGLAAMYYVLADGEVSHDPAEVPTQKTQISTDALLNRQQAERDWMTMYDHQLLTQGNKLKGMDRTASRMDQVQAELDSLRQENQQMKADATRVLDAYQRENDQLKREIDGGLRSPTAPGPIAAASALGMPGPIGGSHGNEVKLVSFGAAPAAGVPAVDGNRIDAGGKQAAAYTDSPNYLPPNSIAQAKVVVGVDAATNVRSQSDPLPVLLRITGPARSVFAEGKLLRTQVQGCMVNGAAYGDLSSEKVYVKLQRMTCPQAGGRYAVSEVKGFISFGGKVGLRGRVVSREGGLIGQAFLAGMAGGFGRGFSANANSIFSGTNLSVDGERQQLAAGDIVKGGLGEGISKAGDTVSDYLIERAEQYQPVIEMPTGADVEVVFLDGTFIRN
ncbi:TraB/VirB10 family protein [Novosphingobium sp. P6W]|uniref:TraB/VirB10 family protein n=1 Tax=Novosphingobium sp. P6W TaxID=1609758 RepID=UPI0005C2FF74|nr:TraB/VirB10 family protein [Novosphingobium sp. P6W]AXB80454.1 conjugal transfer protein TraB [Novosphingobium sp. P6W]KIS31286.1 conjugal transfer protein TraB [Novosphingobium sp. P6W]